MFPLFPSLRTHRIKKNHSLSNIRIHLIIKYSFLAPRKEGARAEAMKYSNSKKILYFFGVEPKLSFHLTSLRPLAPRKECTSDISTVMYLLNISLIYLYTR